MNIGFGLVVFAVCALVAVVTFDRQEYIAWRGTDKKSEC